MTALENNETELFLLAEENGWEYTPACDETYFLLAELEGFQDEEEEQVEQPKPKVNKKKLRQYAIKKYMGDVKQDIDWQATAHNIINDDELQPLFEGKSDEERDAYAMGIVRFCEYACFGEY